MRALLSIVAIAALAAAAPDELEPRCNSLATACSDLYLAIECGTVEQCIPRWEKLNAPVGNDTELCATCKKLVQEARDQLLSNMTQTELREVLEGSCDDLLPIRPLNTICKKVMDTFQDELNDVLVSRMDPTQVCTVSGLCWKPDNSDIEQRASHVFLKKSLAKSCGTCKSSVSKIVGIAKFADKGDVIRGFSNACRNARYPQLKCDEFAHTYFAKLLHHIQSAPHENTCQFLGQCDGMSRPMIVGPKDNMECEFCEAMIHRVVVQFNNTSMKEQVKTVLENICKKTGTWAAECQQRIADDFDVAYDELISMLDPVRVCSLAGICIDKERVKILPLTRLTPARPAAPGSTAMCTICQDVAKVVQKAVNANFTQNQLVSALDLVCDVLPVVSKGNCFDFVNKNVPQLIQMFNERFTVEHICSESFKLCPAVPVENAVGGEVTCIACKFAVDFLRLYVNKSDSDEEIVEAFVADLCGLSPFAHRNCMNFVEENFPRLLKYVQAGLDSGVICKTLLHLCVEGNSEDAFPDYLIIGRFSDEPSENCSVCLTAMSWVFHFANGRRHRVVIKFGLDEVCNKYPNILVPCKRFKDAYSARIMDLVEKENITTAQEVCARLALCPESLNLLAFTELRAEFREDKCQICEKAVSWVASELNATSTEDEIIKLVQEVCNTDLFPPRVKSSCRNEIEAYGSLIIHLLVKRMDPGQICTEIRLCNAPRVKHAAPVSSPVCDECLLIANHIVAAIKDDKTEQNIKKVLDATCQSCPDQAGCKKFIDDNLDRLFELLRQDVTADQICQALRLCRARLAVHEKVDPKSGICDQCLEIANYIVDAIKDDKTEQNIKYVLDKTCQSCPDYAACKQFIDDNVDQLFELLRQDVTAAQICHALRLCGARGALHDKVVANSGICDKCLDVANRIVDAIKDDKTEQNIKNVLDQTCQSCPDQAGCKKFIDDNIDRLFELLRQDVTAAQICQALRLCSSQPAHPPKIAVKSEMCDKCLDVANRIVDAIKDDKTEQNIKNVLDQTCQSCPDQAGCKKFIDDNIDRLFELLRQDVTAAQICQALRLCSAQPTHRPTIAVRSEMCDKCLDVANRIVDAIKNDRTERNIKRVLDRTCQNCPDQAGCKKFIDDNIDQLFELLRQDVTAAQICKALKLCGARLVHQSLVINKQGRAEVCDQCLQIATHIVNAIENNRTEENIKNTLDRACLLCPNRFGCKQWVNDNIDELYEMLREDVTPAQICELLRFCDGSEIPAALVANVENCGVCSMIVDYIIDELKDNSTDAAILDTFEKVCKVLPVDQQQCRNYIDVYGGYIVSLIEKKYAADAICAAIGLCETRKPVRQTPKTPKTICNECQLISGYLVSAVNDNHSEENIKAVVEKVCELIPMDVGQCQQFIDTNLDQLYQLLREEVTVDHICQTLRLCGTRVFPVPVRPEIKVKSCGLCSEVVDYLIGAIKDNSTDAEILDAVERVCKVLPFDKTECQNVINVYGGYIIDMIQRNVAADVICQKIGFCAPPPQRVTSDSCQLCRMISGFVISELKDNTTDAAILAALERGCSVLPIDQAQCRNVIDVYGSMIVSMVQRNLTPDDICGTLRLCAASRPRGQSCDLCETVANFLVDELKDNKTDAAILEALERVCSVLPVDKVSCQNTIDVYGKMIMDLIQKDASADQICAVIGLCSSQKVVERAKSDFCDACKMIAGFLVDELKDNKTDAAILAALEKVCKVVPVDNVQCKNYIDVYGDMVIEMIKNNLSPDEICSSIGYCSAKKVLALSDNQACPMCEIVVHVVEAELQNNNTQKEIRTALEKACSLLPENDAQQCRNMVNVYTAYIIDMVESLATAEQICQTLGFCPTPPSPPKCEVCLFITNFVESELSDNRTESQILKLLDKACDVIPNMDVPQCKETINQFSDMIITLLLQSVPPRKICEEIKMCPVSTKPVPAVSPVRGSLADKEQCTFCKWLVTWVDEKLYDNRTEAAIVDELDKACDLLTDAGKCKEMVNDYTDMIVKMLSQWADPEKICEAIKKCPSQKFTKDEPPCRYCRYVIDELRDHMHKTEDQLKKELDGICRVIPVDTSSCQAFMEKYAERIITMIMMDTDPEEICELLRVCPKKLKTTDSECSFCREVMRFVANEVKDETTDDEIIGFVSKACNFVPQPHREDCQRMVEIEGVVIVRMIGESLDANSICAALNYCPQARHPEKLTCTWCQYALHFIQEKLYDNSTQQMIREELEKMCSDLPKPELSNECKEFVDAYGPSLEVIIAQDLDPSIICPAIHACPSRGILSKPARRPSSQKCHDCVSTLRSFRHNPAQICKGVSSQFAGKCVGASSVGLRLVNAFESDYQICKYAKSCSKVSGSFRCNRGGCQHVR